MALPAYPNQITFGDIEFEFGGGYWQSLSDYYKGGSYVLNTDTAPNVPSSGQISFSNFHSAAKVTWALSLSDYDVSGYCGHYGPGTCTAISDSTTVQVVGTPPFTYSWQYYSGSSFTIDSPSSATTTFRATSSSGTSQGYYRCYVTDSAGHTGWTGTVLVSLTYERTDL